MNSSTFQLLTLQIEIMSENSIKSRARFSLLLPLSLITIISHVNYIFFLAFHHMSLWTKQSVTFCLSFHKKRIGRKSKLSELINRLETPRNNKTDEAVEVDGEKVFLRNELSRRDHYARLWQNLSKLASQKIFASAQIKIAASRLWRLNNVCLKNVGNNFLLIEN